MTKLDKAISELSSSQEKLISDFYNLKKDFAIKLEEIQALYMEIKSLNKKITRLEEENHSLKQQIKQLEKEAEEMLLYP
jgi:peptidoglycan hydrolase CwlO-like protein